MNITCDEGWVQYNRSCYKYVPTFTYWTAAFRECQAQNSYLADVDSDEELTFLMSKILKSIDNSELYLFFIVLFIDISRKLNCNLNVIRTKILENKMFSLHRLCHFCDV